MCDENKEILRIILKAALAQVEVLESSMYEIKNFTEPPITWDRIMLIAQELGITL